MEQVPKSRVPDKLRYRLLRPQLPRPHTEDCAPQEADVSPLADLPSVHRIPAHLLACSLPPPSQHRWATRHSNDDSSHPHINVCQWAKVSHKRDLIMAKWDNITFQIGPPSVVCDMFGYVDGVLYSLCIPTTRGVQLHFPSQQTYSVKTD